MNVRPVLSRGAASYERAYAGSDATILRCNIPNCVNYTMERRDGKPVCERCAEEIDALERMAYENDFNREFGARVRAWKREHVKRAKRPWTNVDRSLMVFVLGALACLGYLYGLLILEWIGIGVR